MKTWKTISVTGLLLAGLLMSGTAQARFWDRSDHRPNYHQGNYHHENYHHEKNFPQHERFNRFERHHEPMRVAEREHGRYWHEKERRHAWFR